MLTVLVNLLIWDRHASSYGILSLMVCLLGATAYKQAPLREEARTELSARRVCQLVSGLVVLGILLSTQARSSSGMLVTLKNVRGQPGGVLGDAALAVPPAEGGAAAGLSPGAADGGANRRPSRRHGLQPLLKLSAAGKARANNYSKYSTTIE